MHFSFNNLLILQVIGGILVSQAPGYKIGLVN